MTVHTMYKCKFTGGSQVTQGQQPYGPDFTAKPGETYMLPEAVCRSLAGRWYWELPKEFLDMLAKERGEETKSSKRKTKK